MKCGTPWARTCSTPWRRTTVWTDSVAAPCGPSASTSWTTLGRRSSPSPDRSSACPASSPVVYKRWAEQLWLRFLLLSLYLEDVDRNLSQSPRQLEVQAPPGNPVGYIIQQWHPFSPKFIVTNEHSEPVLKIHGPFCGWSCLPDVDFEVGSCKPDPNLTPTSPLHLGRKRVSNRGSPARTQCPGFSLCRTVWPLLHGSASFIKLQREGIWVSATDLPLAPQHGWLEHYLSILLLLQLL